MADKTIVVHIPSGISVEAETNLKKQARAALESAVNEGKTKARSLASKTLSSEVPRSMWNEGLFAEANGDSATIGIDNNKKYANVFEGGGNLANLLFNDRADKSKGYVDIPIKNKLSAPVTDATSVAAKFLKADRFNESEVETAAPYTVGAANADAWILNKQAQRRNSMSLGMTYQDPITTQRVKSEGDNTFTAIKRVVSDTVWNVEKKVNLFGNDASSEQKELLDFIKDKFNEIFKG